MNTIKEEAMEAIKSLDDNATWDDLAYTLYVRQKVYEGREDIRAGRVISHEDIKKEFLKNKNKSNKIREIFNGFLKTRK